MVKVQLIEKLDYEKLEKRIDKYIEDAIKRNRQLAKSLNQLLTAGLNEDSLNEMAFNIAKTSEEDSYISRKISKYIKELLQSFRSSKENFGEMVISLKKQIEEDNSRLISLKNSMIKDIKELELEQRTNIGLSLYKFQMYANSISEGFTMYGIETNTKIIEHILKDGDKPLIFPDNYVFEVLKVSNLVKRVLQQEKIGIVSSNNILGDVYIPNFHDKDGNVLPNNDELRNHYVNHMDDLNNRFIYFSTNGISVEDAKNILPCSSLTNLVFSVDAMKLKNLIIKLIKTEYASIQELYVFGKRLYEIAKEKVPFIIAEIDGFVPTLDDDNYVFMDEAVEQLEDKGKTEKDVVDIRPSTKIVDDAILISSIMNRYHYSYRKAKKVYDELSTTVPDFRKKLMKAIASSNENSDLETVMFDVNASVSLNMLDKLNAYADILPCDILSNDLTSFKTPSSIKGGEHLYEEYNNAFKSNIELCNMFEQKYGVRKEDLVYFVMNGNMINTLIRFNGKSLRDFVKACEKDNADLELKELASKIRYELNRLEGAVLYSATIEGQSGYLRQIEDEDPQRLLELK